MAKSHEVVFVYVGTRDNRFYESGRLEVHPSFMSDTDPTFIFATNHFNQPIANVSGEGPVQLADYSTYNYLYSEKGELLQDSAFLRVQDYNARGRPWYTQTRQEQGPLFVPPYIWIPQNILGFDLCTPVYDRSGLPPIDPMGGFQESLSGVACCGTTLEFAGSILSELDLGDYGVAFLVEKRGPAAGKLVAAAKKNQALPVLRVLSDDNEADSRLEYVRLSAIGYPDEASDLISAVSSRLLEGKEGWDEIGELSVRGLQLSFPKTDHPFKPEVLEQSLPDVANLGYFDLIGIRATTFDGTIENWRVGPNGQFNAQSYKAAGMNWLFVIAMPYSSIELEESMQSALKMSNRVTTNYYLAVPIIVACSLLLSYLCVLPAIQTLRALKLRIEDINQLVFSRQRSVSGSAVRELAELDRTFIRMNTYTEILARFVPTAVVDLLFGSNDSEWLTAGELCLERHACTVLCAGISNFTDLADQYTDHELSNLIDTFLSIFKEAQAGVGGTVTDFVAERVVIYWPEMKYSNHADRACKLALKLSCAMNKVLDAWTSLVGDRPLPKPKVCFGIHSGPFVFVGNFGSNHRLKFGLMGEDMDVSKRLMRLAASYATRVVVSSTTSEKTLESYKRSAGGTMDVGKYEILFYELEAEDAVLYGAFLDLTMQIAQERMGRRVILDNASNSPCGASCWSWLQRRECKGSLLAVLFFTVQVLLTLAVLELVNREARKDSSGLLNATLHNHTDSWHAEQLLRRSQEMIYHQISELPQCAETLKSDILVGKFNLSQGLLIARSMQALVTHYRAAFAYMGTRENYFFESGRVEPTNMEFLENPSIDPEFLYATNFFNKFPNNATEYTDTSTINFPYKPDGNPDMEKGWLRVKGYNTRLRGWYNGTRYLQKSNWLIYLWLPQLVLGLDVCTPVYDEDSDLPRIDPSGRYRESLLAVSCCDVTLEFASVLLSKLQLGRRGVAFILDSQEGANEGLLVAAAEENKTLPIALVQDDESDRLQALNYPKHLNDMIGPVANRLLQNRTRWSAVGEEMVIGDILVNGTENRFVEIRAATLDGSFPSLRLSENHSFHPEGFKTANMRWIFVICIVQADFISVAEPLAENERVIRQTDRNRYLIGSGVTLVGVLMIYLLSRVFKMQLQTLEMQMKRVQAFEFTFDSFKASNITELSEIERGLNELVQVMRKLVRYVHPEVIERILKEQDRDSLANSQAAKPQMKQAECTILSISISNFAEVSDQVFAVDLVKLMDILLQKVQHQAEVNHGHLSDFDGSSITVFWSKHLTDDASDMQTVNACKVAENLLEEMDLLNQTWDLHGISGSPSLKLVFGMTTGQCLIGNWGTETRLTWGVLGSNVEAASRLTNLAKSVNTQILLTEEAREHTRGHYVCSFVQASPLGLIYTIQRRASHFGSCEDLEEMAFSSKCKKNLLEKLTMAGTHMRLSLPLSPAQSEKRGTNQRSLKRMSGLDSSRSALLDSQGPKVC